MLDMKTALIIFMLGFLCLAIRNAADDICTTIREKKCVIEIEHFNYDIEAKKGAIINIPEEKEKEKTP